MSFTQADVSFSQNGGELRAAVSGEIDHHSSVYLRKKIDEEICYRRPDRLTMDFSGVTFMDSSGLGLLVGRKKTAEKLGCGFSLCHPGERVMRLLELSGADGMFEIANE